MPIPPRTSLLIGRSSVVSGWRPAASGVTSAWSSQLQRATSVSPGNFDLTLESAREALRPTQADVAWPAPHGRRTWSAKHSDVGELRAAADVLGHSPDVLLKTYAHALPDSMAAVAERIGNRRRATRIVVSAAAGPGRRKLRLVRSGDGPMIFKSFSAARPATSPRASRTSWSRAARSRTYVIDQDGSRSVLYGVSVFVLGEDGVPRGASSRFAMAPGFIRAAVGTIRRAGFEVLPTGENRDHFDIQLLSGRSETEAAKLFSARSPTQPGG